MKDRRDFLKVFGVTSAVVATSSTARGIEPEKISDPTITPIKTDFPPIPNAKDVSYVVDGVLYSALELNAEEEFKPTFNNFFSYGFEATPMLGGRRPNLNDTNLCNACRLDTPESFLVRRIGFLFSPTCDPNDRSKFIENFTMDLWLGQKTYWRSPVSHLFCVGEVGVNEKDRVNPEVPMQYMHELEIPLIIQDQMSFRVGLTGTEYFRPEHRMKMWSVLSGLHARGIQ